MKSPENAAPSLVLPLQLSADAALALRQAIRLTPDDIERIADAVAAKLINAPKHSTPRQVAERNCCSRAYVYAQIKSGKLRATRRGGDGDYAIAAADEAAWLAGVPPSK